MLLAHLGKGPFVADASADAVQLKSCVVMYPRAHQHLWTRMLTFRVFKRGFGSRKGQLRRTVTVAATLCVHIDLRNIFHHHLPNLCRVDQP